MYALYLVSKLVRLLTKQQVGQIFSHLSIDTFCMYTASQKNLASCYIFR